jgi:ankyrin repeat protein
MQCEFTKPMGAGEYLLFRLLFSIVIYYFLFSFSMLFLTLQTALHVAVCKGSYEMVVLLASSGANVNQVIVRRNGQHPIHIACIAG